MLDRFAGLVVDHFTLLAGSGCRSCGYRRGRRRRRTRCCWILTRLALRGFRSDNSTDRRSSSSTIRLALRTNKDRVRIVIFLRLFNLLEVHRDGNLRADFACTDRRFEDLNNLRSHFAFDLLACVELLAGQRVFRLRSRQHLAAIIDDSNFVCGKSLHGAGDQVHDSCDAGIRKRFAALQLHNHRSLGLVVGSFVERFLRHHQVNAGRRDLAQCQDAAFQFALVGVSRKAFNTRLSNILCINSWSATTEQSGAHTASNRTCFCAASG